jgi:hypothetical protein
MSMGHEKEQTPYLEIRVLGWNVAFQFIQYQTLQEMEWSLNKPDTVCNCTTRPNGTEDVKIRMITFP